MKYDRKMIRAAIKARIDSDNDWNLYGHAGTTRWDARLPEHHFYMRDHKLRIVVKDGHGEVVDEFGNAVAKWVRKWSTRKVHLTYKELMPTIEWV